MSDAKIVDTSTDIQKQIDAKYSLILEKLKVYDDYASTLTRLEKSDDLIFSIIKSLDEKAQSQKQKLSDSLDEQAFVIVSEKNKSADICIKLDALSKSHESFCFDLDVFKERHARLHSETQKMISQVAEKSIHKDAFDEYARKISLFLDSTCIKFKDLDQLISDVRISLEKQASYLLRLQSDHEDLKSDHLKFKDINTQRSMQITQRMEDHISSQVGCSDQISSDLSASVKELKRLNEASISSIQLIESDLKARMESLALDATNAVSRSSNVEMHAKILDKKVDAINLQLRKNELS